MNILHSAWRAVNNHRVVVVRSVVLVVRVPLRLLLAETIRRRAISDLESLPQAILRDIGVRREEIPVVVAKAAQARHDSGEYGDDTDESFQEDTSLVESATEAVSRSEIA